jgi:hypothetical protein
MNSGVDTIIQTRETVPPHFPGLYSEVILSERPFQNFVFTVEPSCPHTHTHTPYPLPHPHFLSLPVICNVFII